MPLTLEMPLESSTPSTLDPVNSPSLSTADAAVAMLETPTDGDGDDSEEILRDHDGDDPPAVASESPPLPEPTADVPAEASGKAKKKRTRKPKASKEDAEGGPPAEPIQQSPQVTEQLAKVEMSRSTRLFQIAKVESEYVEVTLAINANEELIEDAKAENKHLGERQRALAYELRHLRNDEQWQPELPLADPDKSPPAAAVEPGQVVDGAANSAATAPPEQTTIAPSNVNSEAWRNVSIYELILPPKLMEKLADAEIYTIGDLEIWRGEISQGHAKWPKGIGPQKITLIEDAVVKWLTANRDAAAFAAAGSVSQGEVVQSAAPASPIPPAKPDSSDSEVATALTARATTLDDGSLNCLTFKHPGSKKYYESGFEAYSRGLELTECPYIVGPEQDDWLRGWMAARAVRDIPDAPTAAKPIQTPSSQVCSLDDF